MLLWCTLWSLLVREVATRHPDLSAQPPSSEAHSPSRTQGGEASGEAGVRGDGGGPGRGAGAELSCAPLVGEGVRGAGGRARRYGKRRSSRRRMACRVQEEEELATGNAAELKVVESGEKLQGKYGKTDFEGYDYISDLTVARIVRHHGIATNMMQFAIETAKSNGVEVMYVHVDRNNKPALQLFEKMGFEMIEEASEGLVEDNTYLLRCSLYR
ncbi:unnamed protein product [Linum tenue]|uniref:N-acetyltransferase domain-containing protein n=1 Tax=Linum tenue TaxID=586396 RepID=A0AAV0HTS2_9ROSI|nr:unnamed protein product [Linum tenue]